MVAEQDRAQQLGETLVARAAKIGLGHLRIDEALLGLLHHFEDRGVADSVAKNAHADVDLLGPRICVTQRDQPEQRIVDDGREVGEAPRLCVRLGQHGLRIS